MASMNKNEIETLAAQLLHHRAATLAPGDSVVPAIFPAAVFHLPGNPSNAPFVYGRYSNPTWEALEAALSLLEGAETLIFPSGMAAIGGRSVYDRARGRPHFAAGGRLLHDARAGRPIS